MSTDIPKTADLICYLDEGWAIDIRPAPATRAWMDETPLKYAYRCLPITVASAHGWQIANPCAFQATWNGGPNAADLSIEMAPDAPMAGRPSSLFGAGVLTWNIFGIFRTSPGWNLWVGGPPNEFKDGIHALTGVIETDWSPYSFTMNWKMTRPGTVAFAAGEPFCHFFPVQRGVLDQVRPQFRLMREDGELNGQFHDWVRATDAFRAEVAARPPANPADQWQKKYFRGQNMAGTCPVADHETKLRLKPFEAARGKERLAK